MARRFFRSVVLALACLAASLLSSSAFAQAFPSKPPERVSQITVTPEVADAGIARAIKISGNWMGCVPVAAAVTPAMVFAPGTRVARLIFPQTLAPCAAVIAPYTVTATYTPAARGIEKLLVLNVDGDYLGEAWVDTRAPGDDRSAFNITGMWYDPQSNGSGLTFMHSRVNDNAVFGTWYVYDSTGKPRWYTIQDTVWKSQGRVMEGVLIQTLGAGSAGCPPPLTACPSEQFALRLVVGVGRARITLTGPASALVEALAPGGAVTFSSNVIRAEI